MTKNKPKVKKEGAPHVASWSGQQPQPQSSSGSGGQGGCSWNSFRRPVSKARYSQTIFPTPTLKGENTTLSGFIFDSAEY